jgi:hypothetical protein
MTTQPGYLLDIKVPLFMQIMNWRYYSTFFIKRTEDLLVFIHKITHSYINLLVAPAIFVLGLHTLLMTNGGVEILLIRCICQVTRRDHCPFLGYTEKCLEVGI